MGSLLYMNRCHTPCKASCIFCILALEMLRRIWGIYSNSVCNTFEVRLSSGAHAFSLSL